MRVIPGRARRALAVLTAVVVIAAGGVLATASAATAVDPLPSPAPVLQRDESVAASNPLPTVQIDDGYIWAQTTVGNIVYAVGSFSNARPAGAAAGTNLTPRSNILAFDITTGDLITSFAPSTNGPIKSVTPSPDGSRIYIGGSFNTVNGQPRNNIAALDAVTGALVPGFAPSIGGTGVYAIATSGTSVYVGGAFGQANATARRNLAAFNSSNGALLPWAPTTDRQVDAMVMEPGNSKVIAGGRFYQTNDQVQRGLVALHPTTGAIITSWLAPKTVINGWSEGEYDGKAGIFALNVDGTGVYGTGWVLANASVGNLEGVFAANAGDGSIRWVADCHGDHYGVYSTGKTVYTTSHTHACDTVGLAPELDPRTFRYVEAFTADARGVLTRSPSSGSQYKDWSGTPSPSAYAWYPDFTVGTTSGLGQAGLSITGSGDFVSIGGEFASVNNRPIRGLVRFSTKPAGGAIDGPRLSTTAWEAPTVSSVNPGSASITMPTNWDRDDRDLTYELIRSGAATPVATAVAPSTWWNRPRVSLYDSGLTPGSSQSYTVLAKDAAGNTVTSRPVSVTIASGDPSAYAGEALQDGAGLLWRLGGVTLDWAGSNHPLYGSGVSTITPGALNEKGSSASAFAGNGTGTTNNNSTNTSRVSSPLAPVGPSFSTEIWFKTSTQKGGKLIGYGSSQTGSSGSYDRHIYMTNDGRLVFGVYPGAVKTVSSSATYRDNAWHHVVGTLGADGMKLYVDGKLVGSDAGVTSAQAYNGYWRVGGDNLSGWPSSPSSYYLAGSLDEAAVYPAVLSPAQISTHYAVGRGQALPTAGFTSSSVNLDASFESTSTAPSGRTITNYAWNFGDGSTGTGATPTHSYTAAGRYDVTLTITDSAGLTNTVTNEIVISAENVLPTASFTMSTSGLTASVNGAASSDSDGTISGHSWNWGDGSPTSSGATSAHRYAAAGTYTVTLTVTDDRGGVATTTRSVTVSHAGPTANFTAFASGLAVSVDASSSAASDGATMTYAWNWGDNTPDSTGLTANHTYAAAGPYTVTLTVTDSFGAMASTSQPVTVSTVAFAGADDFSRVVSSGWGAADAGGTWSALYGAASAASVSGGVGQVTLPAGHTRNMALQSLALQDVTIATDFSLAEAPVTGSSYAGVVARQNATDNYQVRVWLRNDGSVWLVTQRGNTVLNTYAVPGITRAAGETFTLRAAFVGTGTTTIQAKLWRTGEAEPASWQIVSTDATPALQSPGYVAVHANRGSASTSAGTFTFDNFRAAGQ